MFDVPAHNDDGCTYAEFDGYELLEVWVCGVAPLAAPRLIAAADVERVVVAEASRLLHGVS